MKTLNKLTAISYLISSIGLFGLRLLANEIELSSIDIAYQQAVKKIKSSQSQEGHWKTDFVWGKDIFSEPQQEVNVWTPSLMVEILEPITQETNLEKEMDSAISYLQDQYESDGTVRYHGKGSDILPPDADDTALIWRSAPKEDVDLRKRALEKLSKFRTKDNLYPMWLVEGGRKPLNKKRLLPHDINPIDTIDMGTQLHIYIILKKYAPDAAEKLCDAISQNINNTRYWPYFGHAPWIYVLREIDLHKSGCAPPRPQKILKSFVQGQGIYMELVKLLRDVVTAENVDDIQGDKIKANLTEIARDDFGVVEKTPLLLYHSNLNTMKKKYRRTYWSKELVYALWLRLYVESSRRIDNWDIPKSIQ